MNPEIDAACSEIYPTVSVNNLQETIDYYHQQLGFKIQFMWGEPPVHAGVTFGKTTVHFSKSKTPTDNRNERFWLYFVVEDVDALHDIYLSREIEILDPPTDREWGMREIAILDINKIHLRFGQPDLTFGDPVSITRTKIDANIESRLANLLSDLAAHKGMTVGEVLEETLLHSFESTDGQLGASVASPHTARTMNLIEQLKKQHGIDYETHAIYRFKET